MGAILGPDDAAFPEYYWMCICAIIFGFTMAFGIGANDVANSFGTSVASKAITLGQAIIVAFVFEFLGAILLGQSVTGTIRNGIVFSSFYEDQPEVLMYGMLNALAVASVWLLTATYLELAVSTTHTIVAAIIGFSLAAEGFDSVNWMETGKVFISWFASPLFSGVISFFFYFTVKKVVFIKGISSDELFNRAMNVYPVVVFIGVGLPVLFIVIKSKGKISEWKKFDNFFLQLVLPVALVTAVSAALLTKFVFGPMIREKVIREHDEFLAEEQARADALAAANMKQEEAVKQGESGDDSVDVDEPEGKAKDPARSVTIKDPTRSAHSTKSSLHQAFDWFADQTFRQDLEAQSFAASEKTKDMWENTEKNDPKVERLFGYLQVFTACLTAFSHGSNDVANAIAPLSAVLEIQRTGTLNSKSEVAKWILALGGAGIGIGFTFFGYRTLRALGYKLICVTPSRGFCIELATALAVAIASFLKIPVSTTQCLVGATVGAGVAHGGFEGVQWLFLLRTMCGWVGIFLTSCIFSAGFFAYCVYSPSLIEGNGIRDINATRI